MNKNKDFWKYKYHPSKNIEERNLFVKGVPYEENGKLKVKIYTIKPYFTKKE